MIARLVLLVAAVALCCSSIASADDARAAALLERANGAFARAVENGSKDSPALREAIAAYSAVLDGGLDGARLRLNLGAAHAQAGDAGHAAFHLREAARLATRAGNDADARAASVALRAVTGDARDAWPPASATPGEARALRLVDRAGATALTTVFLASWCAGWALVAWRLIRPGGGLIRTAAMMLLAVGGASGGALAWGAWAQRGVASIGVVVAGDASLRSGPRAAFPSLGGALAPGEEVRVLETRDEWLRVRMRRGGSGGGGSGGEGWVEAASVALP